MGLKLTDPRVNGDTNVSVIDVHSEVYQVLYRRNGNMDVTMQLYNNKADFDAGKGHFDMITLRDMTEIPATRNTIETAVRQHPDYPASTPAN